VFGDPRDVARAIEEVSKLPCNQLGIVQPRRPVGQLSIDAHDARPRSGIAAKFKRGRSLQSGMAEAGRGITGESGPSESSLLQCSINAGAPDAELLSNLRNALALLE
jgi:hypothetical protein